MECRGRRTAAAPRLGCRASLVIVRPSGSPAPSGDRLRLVMSGSAVRGVVLHDLVPPGAAAPAQQAPCRSPACVGCPCVAGPLGGVRLASRRAAAGGRLCRRCAPGSGRRRARGFSAISGGSGLGGRTSLPEGAALVPVRPGVDLALGEAESVAQPGPQMPERSRLGGTPHRPVRPVTCLERCGEGLLAASRDPLDAQPWVCGGGGIVLLGRGGRVGRAESPRTRYPAAAPQGRRTPSGGRPRGRGGAWPSGRRAPPAHGARRRCEGPGGCTALVLGPGAVGVGEPEPQPGGGSRFHLVEQRR